MLPFPEIDPVIVSIGPLSVRWYGLMYIAGFLSGYLLVKKQIREQCNYNTEKIFIEYQHVDSLLFYLILGVIVGGRLGYVLFYNLSWYIAHPKEIFALWHGGMAFHGGAAGALIAGGIYSYIHKISFLKWSDRFTVTAPIGLGFGRIGNFINGELYGRTTDVPWGMIFPQGGLVPRHPSQLYEGFLEGPLLFAIIWPLRKKELPDGTITGIFFVAYAVLRIFAEFFREPDRQLGFIYEGWLTMGQLLSAVIFFAGICLCIYAAKKS